ncbi:MAG: hypothetical protein ABIW82_17540 [Dokdonella sp.]
MKYRTSNLTVPFALAMLLAACGNNEKNGSFTHFSVVDESHVAIHARGVADAILASDGSLRIDSKAIAMTPAQQTLLEAYYRGVETLRHDAIATGAAGIATAGTAIVSVVSGLASGDPDSIGPKVDAKAAKVEAAATKLCADLAELRKQQEVIVAQLEAFRPYGLIDESDADDCKS